jgi:hypothetical protein
MNKLIYYLVGGLGLLVSVLLLGLVYILIKQMVEYEFLRNLSTYILVLVDVIVVYFLATFSIKTLRHT